MATLPIADVAYAVVLQTHKSLHGLANQLAPLPDENRRALLRQFIAYSRTLLIRLLALVRWLRLRRELALTCEENETRFRRQREELRRAADELYYLHQGLWPACVPAYDVRAAVEIISRGTYSQLPRAIAQQPEEGGEAAARQQAAALRWMRDGLRLRRCAWTLPEGMEVKDASGCLLCTVAGQYEVALVADVKQGAPEEAPLRILRLRPLVATSRSSASGGGASGSKRAWARAKHTAQQLLNAEPAEPLLAIHSDLHITSCKVALDALHAQANALLRSGRWEANLKAERTPEDAGGVAGLQLHYGWSSGLGFKDGGGQRRASVLVAPGEACGMRIRHEPLLHSPQPSTAADMATTAANTNTTTSAAGEKGVWRSLSMDGLDVEQLLLDAVRERSLHALAELSRDTPAAGVAIDDAAPLPLLRLPTGAALAVSHGEGQLSVLGNLAARHFFDASSADPVGSLMLAAPLMELSTTAEALGVSVVPRPPLSVPEGGDETSSASASAPSPPSFWLPLPAMPEWKFEVSVDPDAAAAAPRLRVSLAQIASREAASSPRYVPLALDEAVASTAVGAATATSSLPATPAGTVARWLPSVLATAHRIACLEGVHAAVVSQALQGEIIKPSGGDGHGRTTTLRIAGGAALRDACTPRLTSALLGPSDLPTEGEALLVYAHDDGTWEVTVPGLRAPPGVASLGRVCASPRGSVRFVEGVGKLPAKAVLRYDAPPTVWSVSNMLLDIQGVAFAHVLSRMLNGLLAAGKLPGVTMAEASCAALGVHTAARKHLRFEWDTLQASPVTGPNAVGAMFVGMQPPPHTPPLLLPRVRLDGVVLTARYQEVLKCIKAGWLDKILHICDEVEQPPSA